MNDMMPALNMSTDFSTTATTPFYSSYTGMSDGELEGLAQLQSSYSPSAPMANQQEALSLLQAAMHATDPSLKNALLQQALALLTPGGGSATPAGGGGAPAAGGDAPAAGDGAPAAGGAAASGNADPSSFSTPSSGTSAESTPLTVDSANNSINTGRYTISGSNRDDGSLTITDNQTGKTVEVWGDPHIKVNGQNVADFQKDGLTIQLQDGTQVHIQPTALSNGVSHINQVSVTKGDQAVTMSGFTTGQMHTSDVMNGAAEYQNGLYNAPNEINVTEGDDDNLYYNNANGSMGSEITAQSNGSQTNLDGAGGGLVGPGGVSAQPGSSGSNQDLMAQLAGSIQSYSSGMYQMEMMSLLSELQSNSGFMQA